ncbi:hypothetical protein X742_15950 [Mesorhizobium sp. LNHC232B00]|nr:hypothetical protein X742_15950 [Mesorhizobium sp. LNHC232B00]
MSLDIGSDEHSSDHLSVEAGGSDDAAGDRGDKDVTLAHQFQHGGRTEARLHSRDDLRRIPGIALPQRAQDHRADVGGIAFPGNANLARHDGLWRLSTDCLRHL